MRKKLRITGIAFMLICCTMIAQRTFCQNTSPPSVGIQKDGLFCLDSIQYEGLLTLYVNYQKELAFNRDLQLRLSQAQDAYTLCQSSFVGCKEELDITTDEYFKAHRNALKWEYDARKYRQQRNYMIIGGVGVSVSVVVLALLLK